MEYQITKILIISFFSSLLILLFLNTKYFSFFKKYSKNIKIFINSLIYFFSSLILILLNYWISLHEVSTLIIFNAAIITIIYFELAIFLEKVFWDDFLGNSLPKSINMLISFVVMMNFGYFGGESLRIYN